jgi:hypothetical protein
MAKIDQLLRFLQVSESFDDMTLEHLQFLLEKKWDEPNILLKLGTKESPLNKRCDRCFKYLNLQDIAYTSMKIEQMSGRVCFKRLYPNGSCIAIVVVYFGGERLTIDKDVPASNKDLADDIWQLIEKIKKLSRCRHLTPKCDERL